MPTEVPFEIPGPRRSIIGPMGNVVTLTRDPLATMTRLFKEYGRIVALSEGGGNRLFSTNPKCPGVVFVYGPDLIRTLQSQHDVFYKNALTGIFYPPDSAPPREAVLRNFVSGLFSVNSNEHRRQRRMIAPAFHKKHVETYHADIIDLTQHELDSWQPGETRDIHLAMQELTLRIVTKTLFGGDLDSALHIGQKMQESIHLMINPTTYLLRYDVPGLPYHRLLNKVSEIEQGVREVIAGKQANSSDQYDLLSMLLATRDEDDGSSLTEDEIVGHASLIFAAGHDTSASCLTFTLFLLSQHPRFAGDLFSELDDLLHGAAPTLEQLNQVPLLEYTLKESLRLLPPAAWNMRVAAEPTELGGYKLPKGTEVIASVYHTHRMPELYDQPYVFNPYRWVTLERDTFEYNPFGGGPRMCIGSMFAMQEMKIVLSMLLQRYRLEAIRGTRLDRFMSGTMTVKRGLPMIVQPQDCRFDQGVGGIRGNIREMVELPA